MNRLTIFLGNPAMRRTAASLAAMVIATGAFASASPAAAQAIGFVETQGGTINQAFGNPVLSNLGPGRYQIVFPPALGDGLNSDVQVTAFLASDGPRYCTAAAWGSFGNGVVVFIDCFNATGAPTNADFTAFYQSRTAAPSSGALAFLRANQPSTPSYTPDPQYSYNSTGAVNTITRTNTGFYVAALPGIPAPGNPLVTAYGQNAARCAVVEWYNYGFGVGAQVFVPCVNAAGEPADEEFDLSYAYGISHGDGPMTTLGGYAWADNTVAAKYTPSSIWQVNNLSNNLITGQNIRLNLPILNIETTLNMQPKQFIGLLNSVGYSIGAYCDKKLIGNAGLRKYLVVNCFNSQGIFLTSQYTAAFIATKLR